MTLPRSKVIVSLMILLAINFPIMGCVPSNVILNLPDKQFTSSKKTFLVAGFKDVKDRRPEDEKEHDDHYEVHPVQSINNKIHRDLKMSGLFADVLVENFEYDNVEVILEPYIEHFHYDLSLNGYTASYLIIALTGMPGLLYAVCGGPSASHVAEAEVGIVMSDKAGSVIAKGIGKASEWKARNLYNAQSEGIGNLDGRMLTEATYEMLSTLTNNINVDDLLNIKQAKLSGCRYDGDCKGNRICVKGICTNA